MLRTPTTLSLLLSLSSAVGCARSSPRFDPASPVDASAPSTPHSTATREEARQSCRFECAGAYECSQLDSFPDYATTRSDWGNSCSGYLFAIAGTCDDGSPALQRGDGHSAALRYYDSAGTFRGFVTSEDVLDAVCEGHHYWPEVVDCRHPVTTEVICGKAFRVGDPMIEELPWQ